MTDLTQLTCTKQVHERPDVMCGEPMGEMLLVSRDGVHWRAFPRCGKGHTVQEDIETVMVVGGMLGADGPLKMAAIQFGEVEYHEGPFSQEELAGRRGQDRQAETVETDHRLI